MKLKYALICLWTLFFTDLRAQTFSGGVGSIPDTSTVTFAAMVSGLPSSIDGVFGIESICFSLTHGYMGDLRLSLRSPDGTEVILSEGTGGGGSGFSNTCLEDDSIYNALWTGSAPYTGTYKADHALSAFNNMQNPNGVWTLVITDMAVADAGMLQDWSISFSNTPADGGTLTFTSTDIPLVIITTDDGFLPDDEPKKPGSMQIINNGKTIRNQLTDTPNDYNGRIMIEYRGSSSASFPKKPMAFETVDAAGNSMNVSLLGMPAENDWVLLAPYTDKPLMRDFLIHNISRAMGWYASRTQFCEVFINGEYQGIHILMEKVKIDKNRVDLAKLDINDNAGDSLTGGYLMKIDKCTGASGCDGFGSVVSSYMGQGNSVYYQYHRPAFSDLTSAQENYIQTYMNSFDTLLASASAFDPVNGYYKDVDMQSFVDYLIMQEIGNNVDGYRLSSYFYKERDSKGGRLHAGPIWDVNLGFGNADYCDGWRTDVWAYQFVCNPEYTPFWWDAMMTDSVFQNQLKCRWTKLRQGSLHTDTLLHIIDTTALYLDESKERDFMLYPRLGMYVWPNYYVGATYADEINYLKTWITDRMAWLDANIPGNTTNCDCMASIDDLNITEIAYNNDPSNTAGSWIELYNRGSVPLDLSGIRIKPSDWTDSYYLPAGTSLSPGAFLVLAQDYAKFHAQYPAVTNVIGSFGFTLSNDMESIYIYDKNNNNCKIIHYSDSYPYSPCGDGWGRTIAMTDPTLNSTDASSWGSGCVGGSPGTHSICTENIIFTEINYKSSPAHDAGDWIEIKNTSTTTMDLSGWILKDGSALNSYTIPAGTILPAYGYFVLYQDASLFSTQFPGAIAKAGPFGFGLDEDEVLRLYNNTGILMQVTHYDTLSYDAAANGGGYTLNLENANDKCLSSGVTIDCLYGSPAFQDCSVSVPELSPSTSIQLYPNPAEDLVHVVSGSMIEDIYIRDLQNRVIASTYNLHSTRVDLDMSTYSKGIYIIEITDEKQVKHSVKLILQ